MSKKFFSAMMALGLFALMFASVSAHSVDLSTGVGFVGKGEVQTALGYNNKQLQDNADSLVFTIESESVTTWDCYNSSNERTQERARTTTSQGVANDVARVKNQITGFNLVGFVGEPITDTDGPALNSCPSGPWSYVADSTVTTPGEGSVLYVNGVEIP